MIAVLAAQAPPVEPVVSQHQLEVAVWAVFLGLWFVCLAVVGLAAVLRGWEDR